MITLLQQFTNRMTSEELRFHPAKGCFPGDRFGSVFTVFKAGTLVIGIRPSAAGTVQPVFLVQP